ncbi:MAG TPA: hypothetical protein VE081_11185 [Sporichthyaceae bacterium]|nr:hypothetical protein [Sporichthyaceae bacterium]
MSRRTGLSVALVAAVALGFGAGTARADGATEGPQLTLTLSTDTFSGFSWLHAFAEIPGATGAWSVTAQLADTPEKLAAAPVNSSTVADGGNFGGSFATEPGGLYQPPLTGGRRYWVEVTAHPESDTTSAPLTAIDSIVLASTPATETIRAATPIDDLPAGAAVQILGGVDRISACPDQWQPCGFRLTAQLQGRVLGATAWTTVATSDIAQGSLLHAYVRTERTTDYRWYYGPNSPVTPASSPVLRITPHPAATVTAPAEAKVGHAVHMSAQIRPATRGQRVTLQILDGHWRTVSTAKEDAKGVARFAVTPKKSGTWKYRVHLDARPDLLAGESRAVKLKVHGH